MSKKTNLALGGVPREDSRARRRDAKKAAAYWLALRWCKLDRPGKVQVPAGQFQPASAGNQLRCQAEKTPQLPPHAPVGDDGQNQQTQGHGNDQRSRRPPLGPSPQKAMYVAVGVQTTLENTRSADHRQEDLRENSSLR